MSGSIISRPSRWPPLEFVRLEDRNAPAGVTLSPDPGFAVGADKDGAVVQYRNLDGSLRFIATPFGADFTGGIRVATADVNGDGVPDIIAGAGPGGTPRVVVIDGVNAAVLADFLAFETSFTGGVFVAAGDIDNDGKADIVVSPDRRGGPRVQVRRGSDLSVLIDFFGIDDRNFRGGARVAVGDVDGDSQADVVVAAGVGGGPRTAVFDGESLAFNPSRLFPDFFVFEPALRNGSYPAAGDITGDGKADLIFGSGPGGAPRVRAVDSGVILAAGGLTSLDAQPTARLADFLADDEADRSGIKVAAADLDGDGLADILTGPGRGKGTKVNGYLATILRNTPSPTATLKFDAFSTSDGVFVG